jgi:hypothetical protein
MGGGEMSLRHSLFVLARPYPTLTSPAEGGGKAVQSVLWLKSTNHRTPSPGWPLYARRPLRTMPRTK